MKSFKKIVGLVIVFAMIICSVSAEENMTAEDYLDMVLALSSVPGEDSENVIQSANFESGMVEIAHQQLGELGGYYSVTLTEETEEGLEKFTHTTFYNSPDTESKARGFEAHLYGQLIELGIIMDVTYLCDLLSEQYKPKYEHDKTNSEGVNIHMRVATQVVTKKEK